MEFIVIVVRKMTSKKSFCAQFLKIHSALKGQIESTERKERLAFSVVYITKSIFV